MKILFTCFILFFAFQIYFAQDSPPKASLVSDFGKICNEDLTARYDNFFVQLANDPTARGLFVVYGGNLEGRNLNYIKYLMEIYPNARKFDKSRLSFVREKNDDVMKIQFWIVPAGADSPLIKNPFVEEKTMQTVLFDKNWADFNQYNGKTGIYNNGFLDLGCDFSPNVSAFAEKILSDSELTGYLIVYTKFGKGLGRGKQIIDFALGDLTKNYKVPANKLKAIYGGNRKRPEIELWLVPKNGKLPSPTPDKSSK